VTLTITDPDPDPPYAVPYRLAEQLPSTRPPNHFFPIQPNGKKSKRPQKFTMKAEYFAVEKFKLLRFVLCTGRIESYL